jgi:hypothetical protein
MPNITISSDFTTYTEKGLTWISDLPGVHPRDTNGNILLQESGSNNPLLIIEPVKFDFTVESVKRAIETRFNFFQFPVATVAVGENFNLDTDIGPFDIEKYEQAKEEMPDPITTKYIVPTSVDQNGQPEGGFRTIGTSYNSNWFYGNSAQKGFTRVPFSTDNGKGSFEINQMHIDYAKQTNKLVKFKIFVQVVSQNLDSYNNTSKGLSAGINTSFRMRLSRTETYDSWEPWNGSSNQPIIYTEDTGRVGNDPNTSKPWVDANGNLLAGKFGENDYPGLYLEYIVDLNKATPGQKYFVEVEAGSQSWLLADSCRWDIIAIERPDTMPIWGNVLNIGGKSELIDGTNKLIGQYKGSKFEYASPNIEQSVTDGYRQQLVTEEQLREIRRLAQQYIDKIKSGIQINSSGTPEQKITFARELAILEAELISKMTPEQLAEVRDKQRQAISDRINRVNDRARRD